MMNSVERLRVLHINFSDSGGAGIAARRSHQALLEAGVETKLLVAKKNSEYPEVYSLKFSFLRKLWRFFQLKHEEYLKRDVPREDRFLRNSNFLPGFILREIKAMSPDIVHLHWVNSGMLSLREIQKIPYPVVWTLHDLWPLTGSCHCAGTLMHDAIASQYPADFDTLDYSGYSKKIGEKNRAKLLTKPEGVIVLNQNFKVAVESGPWMPQKYLKVIPNCLDLSLFKPVASKISLRNQWGLPKNKRLLLYSAAGLHTRHKGLDLLMESLTLLVPEHIEACAVVLVGGESEMNSVGGMPCYSLGAIEREEEMAQIYQACDIFLCPSREDNFPNAVAEASACGLSVVAFRTGGIPDMIDHLKSGFLAKAFSVKDFSLGIELALQNQKAWSHQAILKSKALYDSNTYAESVLKLYQIAIKHSK